MANGDTSPNRPGLITPGGVDPMAGFYKVFGNMVMLAFADTCVFRGLSTTRTIPYGKSAGFAAIGRAQAYFHTTGKDIFDAGNSLLSTIPHNERVINLDNKIISAVAVSEMDELFNHFDVAGPYAEQLGIALANRYDQLGLITAVKAARATSIFNNTTNGHFAGTVITDSAIATSGPTFVEALFQAAKTMDEKEVPKTDRVVVVPPSIYYNLIKHPNTLVIATANGSAAASNGFPQLGGADGANGSFTKATIYQLAGFRIVMSNHIPTTDIASNDAFFGTGAGGASANGNVYYGDFSKTKAVAFAKPAVGVLQLLDISLESKWSMERQATLMVAKMATGMGVLRPEYAVEFATP